MSRRNEELEASQGAAEAERRRYLELFEFAPDGYVVTDARGLIQEANGAALRLLNGPKEFVVGKPLALFIAQKERGAFRREMASLSKAGRRREWELRLQPHKGDPFDAAITVAPVADQSGKVTGLHFSLRGITRPKQAQAALRRAHGELEAQVRERAAELAQADEALRAQLSERQRAEAALYIRARQQQAVAKLGELALRERDLPKVLDYATATVAETLEVEYSKVLELLPGGKEALLRAGVGWKEGQVGKARVRTGVASQAGYTLLSDAPVVVADLREEKRFSGPPLLVEHGVVSGMSCIIRGTDGSPWGVLGTHTTRRITFMQDDVTFLAAVANILGDEIHRERAEQALRESDERFRLLADSAPVLIWVNSLAGGEFVNREYRQFLGVGDVDVRGYNWAQYIHPEDRDAYVNAYLEAVSRRSLFEAQFRFRRHDGEYRWMKSVGAPHFAAGGELLGYAGSTIDITDIKLAEQALRENEARFRQMADAAPVMIWSAGTDQFCDYFNKPWLDFTGRSLEQELGNGWAEGVHPADLARCLETYAASFDARQHFQTEYRLRRYDGKYRWVLNTGAPRLTPEESFAGYIGSCIDITERKRAGEELRASQAQMEGVIGSAMDAIITVDADQRITIFNAAAEKMFRCSAAEAVGQPLDRFIPERFRAAHREHIHAFGETQVTRRQMGALGSIWGVRAGGEEFPIEASISQLEVAGQKFFTVILRDITERKRAESRLIEQAALLNHAQDAIIVGSLENRVLYWNRGAERLYGWAAEEVIGRPCQDLFYPKDSSQPEEATRAVIEKGEWVGELRQVTKGGEEVMVEGHLTLVRDESGKPKSILAINTNITEKKKLEAQLRRAQRMESIGTLAGGIAHDLNNILSPLLMAAHLLQQKFTDEVGQRWLETIHVNANRAADLVKQVLTFARGAEGRIVQLSPRHLVKDLVKMLTDTFPKSIVIQYSVPNELWSVMGDATELYQVLMNLCLNARDAMPGGGRLSITAENTFLDEIYARMRFDAGAGRFVQITVADTGAGIPPGIMEKIFDPFFTTKEVGQGTGLGLSTVLGVVKSRGGLIDVHSEVGKGTTFKVYLPAVEEGPLRPLDEERRDLPAGGGELILVVDDEATIREITKGALETYGYRVLTADSGPEAIVRCAEHKGEVNAALVDMMMPVMDGAATTRALRRLDPQLKIIATSGMPEESRAKEAASAGAETFLPKPYTVEKLLKTLAEVLGARRQGQAV